MPVSPPPENASSDTTGSPSDAASAPRARVAGRQARSGSSPRARSTSPASSPIGPVPSTAIGASESMSATFTARIATASGSVSAASRVAETVRQREQHAHVGDEPLAEARPRARCRGRPRRGTAAAQACSLPEPAQLALATLSERQHGHPVADRPAVPRAVRAEGGDPPGELVAGDRAFGKHHRDRAEVDVGPADPAGRRPSISASPGPGSGSGAAISRSWRSAPTATALTARRRGA